MVHYTYGEERVRARARAETRSTRVIRNGHAGENRRRERERREEEREKEYRVTRLVISCAKKICLLNIYARWIRYGIGNVASLSGKRNRRKVYRILVETAPRGN